MCYKTTRTIWKNVLQNYTHNLAECATTDRTIWQNVLQLTAQSDRMSIIGEGIEH